MMLHCRCKDARLVQAVGVEPNYCVLGAISERRSSASTDVLGPGGNPIQRLLVVRCTYY